MVMTSQQIAGMIGQQQQMFSGIAAYSQQITPPMAMMSPGMFPYNMGPPPGFPPMGVQSAFQPSMFGGMAMPFGPPSSGGAQAFGESMMGTGLAGLSTATQGLGTIAGYAGLGSMGLGLLGMGGGGLAMGLGALGSAPVAAGLGIAAMGAQQMYAGFQERQGINSVLRRNFGNVMGIGGGRGGRGFSTEEMGGISSMIREMGTEDLLASSGELTRVLDKTASMGMYRGVQSAREFKQKFQQITESLKEVAQIMQTSLEGATSFMEQQKSMGFFSGKDISQQLAATRLVSATTGISIDQATAMAQQGTQLARATGGRGRFGAQAGLQAGGRVAMAQTMGILSDEDIDFATGGLRGAEGAQAFSGRMMETSMRFMQRGAGRAMVAGLWDPTTGGINQQMLNSVMSGETDIRQLRNQARQNIRETGGRRSEFFRDEEQLRSQVLAMGGEYLPMAIYGTHVAQKRGLSMDDPIVQRMMRRRFQMSQGEVEAATKVMQNLPQMQAEFVMKGGQEREAAEYAAQREIGGLTGLGKRLGRIWERDVQNPFKQAADDLTTKVTKGIEQYVDALEGRVTAQMGEAQKNLIRERSEFGRAVSTEAQMAERLGSSANIQKFLQGPTDKDYLRQQAQRHQMGALLGLRPDMGQAGQRAYEQSFDTAGQWLMGATDVFAGGFRKATKGLMGVNLIGEYGLKTFSERGVKASDLSFGLRSLAKDTGIEGYLNEIRGYDPSQMSREERAKALGFTGTGNEDMVRFLEGAQSQMRRDIGYTEEDQKAMGEEYRDRMYSEFQNSQVRDAWKRSYMRGFGGVSNALFRMERMGGKIGAAARKAKGGTKAEQVAFVRAIEEGGGMVKGLRVTDELTKEMGIDVRDYESSVEQVRARTMGAMKGLEEATTVRKRYSATESPEGAARWLAGQVGGGFAQIGHGIATGLTALTGGTIDFRRKGFDPRTAGDALMVGEFQAGIAADDMVALLGDSEVRDAFNMWQLGGEGKGAGSKAEGLKQLEDIFAGDKLDPGRKETLRRVKDVQSKEGKAMLQDIAKGKYIENILAANKVQADQGKEMLSALESAPIGGLGKEAAGAWKELQEIARLRATGNDSDIRASYERESNLMKKITGTEAAKEVQKAISGREGGEYIEGMLQGGGGLFGRFKGRGGARNILTAMLGSGGIEGGIGATSIAEAFQKEGGKRVTENQILQQLMGGGQSAQEAFSKILNVAKETGGAGGGAMSDTQYAAFAERMKSVQTAFADKKITEEEARELAGGLAGGMGGRARASAKAERAPTADQQAEANKHLNIMSTAMKALANSPVLKISPENLKAIEEAAKDQTKPGAG